MGKPSAPAAPNPKKTSAAQTGTNVSTAIANAFLNNPNTVGPDGSVTNEQTGSYTFTDPYTKKSYTVPTFTQTTELSPEQQAIYDQNKGAELNLATLANNQSGFLNDYMATPFEYNPGVHEEWAMGLYDDINSDRIARDDESLRTRLANQGINPGSAAYDAEMASFREGTENSANRFLLDSYGQGFTAAQAQRNQPINEITALLSGSQVSMPQSLGFQGSTIPTTDNAGLINQQYQQQMNSYNQQMAQSNGIMGGLFGLGSALIMSDERTKEDIKPAGEYQGHNVYTYNYKGDPAKTPQIGVMAQEAEKKRPDAVVTRPDGIKMVKMGQLFGLGEAA